MIPWATGVAIRHHTIERTIAFAAGAITIAANAAIAAIMWSKGGVPTLKLWAETVASIDLSALAAVAMVIARFGTRTAGAAMLALALALSATNDTLLDLESLAAVRWHLLLDAGAALTGGTAVGAYIRASQLFPKRLTIADLQRVQTWPIRLPWLRSFLNALLRPGVAWAIGGAWVVAGLTSETLLPSLPVVIIGAIFFYVQWQIGSRIARRRVAWLIQAVLVMTILIAADTAFKFVAGPQSREVNWSMSIVYDVLAIVFGTGCFAMAVFAAGAFNSTLIVRATLAWSAAVAVLLFVINVLASALADQFSNWLGISDRFAAAALGTLAGLALSPVAKWLNSWARRRTATAR